ncbi:MAG: GNAT family N-acetyltransferase [Gammaproteobacteria bacterium]
MHIDQANLNNLTGLWKKYGFDVVKDQTGPTMLINPRWPYRCWYESPPFVDDQRDNPLPAIDYDVLLSGIPQATIIPICSFVSSRPINLLSFQAEHDLLEQALIAQKWTCHFEQTAMFLQLPDETSIASSVNAEFRIRIVTSYEELVLWVDVCEDAFGYDIDPLVLKPLIGDKDMRIILADLNGQDVAAALLYKTGNTIGIHQVGVRKAFQGKGVALCLMNEVLVLCIHWGGKNAVLQASQAGLSLYRRLGFNSQFIIKNYRRRPQ